MLLKSRRLAETKGVFIATAAPFRSRGNACRRILLTLEDETQIVAELAAFTETYDAPLARAVRAYNASVVDGTLILEEARYRFVSPELGVAALRRDEAKNNWTSGIKYQSEVTDAAGVILKPGLRTPQIGALHAIAAHWTLSSEPAVVVMPTGTGKTEVMIASTIATASKRMLIIVPTDPLRTQTADKFLSYGLLKKIGIVSDIDNPVVGILSSKPSAAHIPALEACNIVISTMASIGLADEAAQQAFAALFSHVYFDEAHHIEASTWKKFKKHCSSARQLLFTATPFREDGRPLDGRIIYNFPLSAAQEQNYFKPIRFIEVFEPDEQLSDRLIAQAAVAQLRQDLANGFDHLLLARASRIEDAKLLFEQIYQAEFADLNPVLIHSRTPDKKITLDRIKSGAHKIIVCVDMFGEGFDLPNLKIAALHSVHKSLGITLQFIGRFARVGVNVGSASFVANLANDGVPEALEGLYREDADWNELLANFSYDAINPQAHLSDLVSNLSDLRNDEKPVEISTLALRPKISTQVYQTNEFKPHDFAKGFRKSQHIYQPQFSQHDNVLVFVVNQKEVLDWTDSRDIAMDSWDLYVAYYDVNRKYLYVHSSRKGNATDGLAKAISTSPVKIQGETVFKTFAGVQRLVLFSVGLSSLSKNVRYQMFAGLDVGGAIDPILQQDKMKSNVTGVGYEAGKRRTIGGSRKGKMWAMSSGSLAQWKNWCDEVGAKLASPDIQPDDFLKYTLIPSVVRALPDTPALLVDWPDQLFESSNFRFQVSVAGQAYDFHDCQLDLVSWGEPGSFRFKVSAGTEHEVVLQLTIDPVGEKDSTYKVEQISGPAIEVDAFHERAQAAAFFTVNAPLVRMSDGSQLSGNIILKPREALPDAYDRATIQVINWAGIDFSAESRWKDGQIVQSSIQQKFITHLEAGLASFIIDDDDKGESADIIAIEETPDKIIVYLWHCKYSSGATPGARVKDLYEVCGQAQKLVKWTWSLDVLIKHLILRETKYARGRPTRFIRGSISSLITLRKSARRKFVTFRVGIVQPGFSRGAAPAENLAIIGATNSFIQTITNSPLLVVGSA